MDKQRLPKTIDDEKIQNWIRYGNMFPDRDPLSGELMATDINLRLLNELNSAPVDKKTVRVQGDNDRQTAIYCTLADKHQSLNQSTNKEAGTVPQPIESVAHSTGQSQQQRRPPHKLRPLPHKQEQQQQRLQRQTKQPQDQQQQQQKHVRKQQKRSQKLVQQQNGQEKLQQSQPQEPADSDSAKSIPHGHASVPTDSDRQLVSPEKGTKPVKVSSSQMSRKSEQLRKPSAQQDARGQSVPPGDKHHHKIPYRSRQQQEALKGHRQNVHFQETSSLHFKQGEQQQQQQEQRQPRNPQNVQPQQPSSLQLKESDQQEQKHHQHKERQQRQRRQKQKRNPQNLQLQQPPSPHLKENAQHQPQQQQEPQQQQQQQQKRHRKTLQLQQPSSHHLKESEQQQQQQQQELKQHHQHLQKQQSTCQQLQKFRQKPQQQRQQDPPQPADDGLNVSQSHVLYSNISDVRIFHPTVTTPSSIFDLFTARLIPVDKHLQRKLQKCLEWTQGLKRAKETGHMDASNYAAQGRARARQDTRKAFANYRIPTLRKSPALIVWPTKPEVYKPFDDSADPEERPRGFKGMLKKRERWWTMAVGSVRVDHAYSGNPKFDPFHSSCDGNCRICYFTTSLPVMQQVSARNPNSTVMPSSKIGTPKRGKVSQKAMPLLWTRAESHVSSYRNFGLRRL